MQNNQGSLIMLPTTSLPLFMSPNKMFALVGNMTENGFGTSHFFYASPYLSSTIYFVDTCFFYWPESIRQRHPLLNRHQSCKVKKTFAMQ